MNWIARGLQSSARQAMRLTGAGIKEIRSINGSNGPFFESNLKRITDSVEEAINGTWKFFANRRGKAGKFDVNIEKAGILFMCLRKTTLPRAKLRIEQVNSNTQGSWFTTVGLY
ncbi:hypothetical protein AJ80_04697 [Polytolypa hystricis UAMH7299]|uniref:Uncharacterized protein n=1 Tax=Polytolypa hystricis (strain UAMH7299) TaxID=1447883 RepID=A0A2B7Y909_POLH7|nr:hypothetical protein AJ80_04697 [Polytolypa hystricis UAMH7299]